MKPRVAVLGAGFGGLELATLLSEAAGDRVELTLIDKSDAFTFGFSKLDVMFGRASDDAVRLPYRELAKPGVRFCQETIRSIDPSARRVVTDAGTHEADFLVVALGADYDLDATPGLREHGFEYYSAAGARRVRDVLPTFDRGHAVVGVASWPFKCPPAPSETVLMLHDFLSGRGVRDACEITLIVPMGAPVPPAPDCSKALLRAFEERGIRFLPLTEVRSLDERTLHLDSGSELAYDLFLGVPRHCVPSVVAESGLAQNGWIPSDPKTLQTRFPGVFAIGDCCSCGVPKAGVFAEGQAKVAAASILHEIAAGPEAAAYKGAASCYIEFGAGKVARVDIDFLSGDAPSGYFTAASVELAGEKKEFGSSRSKRWFGKEWQP